MAPRRTRWPRIGATIYGDLLRRVEHAVTFDELRALRRFARRRMEGDDRLPKLEEAIEQRAMAMIAASEDRE
ncbi:MAG TPA: hypothetical protein VFZ21_21990 [Gemmatimonadaceae bacterium]|nr:hypothetical protein [Gemmatimonadaceae bacterium]